MGQDYSKDNNPGIQILRVIACLGVFATHIGSAVNLPSVVARLFGAGASGPYLFFVISGLLMMKSGDLKKGNTGVYLKKRLKRLLPAYYLSLILHFVIYFYGERHHITSWTIEDGVINIKWLKYIFCINAILPDKYEVWRNMGAVWSVSCFLLFYLIAPLIYRFIRSLKRAVVVFLLFMIVSVSWTSDAYLSDLVISTMPLFISGIIIYTLFYDCDSLERRRKDIIVGLEAKTAFLVLITLFALIIYIYSGPQRFFYWNIYLIMTFCAELYAGHYKYNHSKMLSFLDERSYGIYLMHPIAILLMNGCIEKGFQFNIMTYIVTVIVITLLFTEIELVIQKKLFR